MGEHESWAQPPSVLLPNGLLLNEAASVMRVLDSERWLKAEEKTEELIACIQPNPPSEERRNAVADYVRRLIKKCFQCQVFPFGSVPLKTYLPDGDIDLTAFSKNQNLKETWAHQVRDMLESEEKNENAEFRVKEVQYIQAEGPDDLVIEKSLEQEFKGFFPNCLSDISFNQLGGLCTLCFLEEVDHLINQNHLFKRSIILIKAWCYYESRILGAHHGLISTYALETLVLYIFHVFNNSFSGPLEVLYRFLEFFSKFDWDNFCVSLRGPVPISSLPDVTVEPPRKDGGDLLLSKLFLDACSSVYAVFPGGQENQGQPFVSKHFNVIDFLRINNNLGRSVSKGNFFRIRSAFAFGAKRLARLLDCPKEDLFFEVNQFFMNTWDRHGSGHRPDAPGNDLWRLRLSNYEEIHGPENIINDTGIKKNEMFSTRETQDDGNNGSLKLFSQQGCLESASRISDVSTAPCWQSQKNYGNSNNSRMSDQIKKEIHFNQASQMDKAQRSLKPDHLVNDIQGRFLSPRTCSSSESDAYGEVSSQGRRGRAQESGKSETFSTRLDNTRRNAESDTVASHGIRPTDDPSSVRRISSHQSLDVAADSKSGSNSYQDESGFGAMADDFASVSGAQGMHQEEQDLVNMMASSTAQGFNGQFHVPMNLAPHHVPFPLPPSVLASMGYTQRNMAGIVPTNFPMIENPWASNMQFSQGVVPSHLTHYFPGMGLASSPEDPAEPANENFGSVEMDPGEADHDFWHDQDRGSAGRFDLDNGGFEVLQSDDKQQLSSSGYNFHPSSRAGNSGSSVRVQQKSTKENHGSARENHVDDYHYHDNRGNEVFFDDRTVSSRSLAASHTGSLRSKTSSESSWEGSSAKVSKSTREKRGRKTAPFSVPSATHGKDKSVSEQSSTQADDDNRDWNSPSPVPTEMAERNTVPHSAASWQVPRHQISVFEPAQTSGSDSLIPLAPMVLNPNSRQRAMDNSGVLPFTFYATGPPVPFVMLPVYNFPTESGTSDASTTQFSGDEGADNSDSGQNFDSSEALDQHVVSNTSNSMRRDTSLAPSEHKDILDSDFASHWQNLQYGRFCLNSRYPPMVYPPPVMVPPVYLQGHVPWDGPGRPLSANMNLFTQLMGYGGPRLVPVAPLQTLSNRPTGVYPRYVEEMPRYRSGTGTYLPNPKVSVRDRHSTSTRRGNYSYDRNDHHGDREGNWNVHPKSRPSGRSHSRSQAEKPNARLDRLTTNESRSERPWGSHRHDSFPAYQSQNGPIRSNVTQSASANVPYGMYPLPAMNPGGMSSNGPNMPSVVMLYSYDHNTGYGTPAEQLEFGSLGPMGFPSVNEVSQLNEGSGVSGAFEEHRFHSSAAQQSSPDQPSSPHLQR
ncbi:nucleotidyltransferase [Parasponia andersonii]|uniref:Nucleotidyltransferase n=1 Tax=Parasponia andersonii TaxID=3476 RepID=A0A2P5BRF2_PARAD|nr:nucleotidyltransferase [Parasponia andersonii]